MTLEERIKVLEDIEELRQMHSRYAYALNSRNFDEIIDMFADDMREEGFPKGESRVGKEEITKVYRTMHAIQPTPLHATIVAQPVISVKGDTAKAYWLWLGRINDPRKFASPEDGEEVIMALPKLGRYDVEYKRVNGKWKISYLKFTLPWPEKKSK